METYEESVLTRAGKMGRAALLGKKAARHNERLKAERHNIQESIKNNNYRRPTKKQGSQDLDDVTSRDELETELHQYRQHRQIEAEYHNQRSRSGAAAGKRYPGHICYARQGNHQLSPRMPAPLSHIWP
jgi:hypothetical protein